MKCDVIQESVKHSTHEPESISAYIHAYTHAYQDIHTNKDTFKKYTNAHIHAFKEYKHVRCRDKKRVWEPQRGNGTWVL